MGKRPQPRLRIDALARGWRNGEAGEGRGSEPCEPGGLRHQAGGASSRAPQLDPVGRISPGPTRWPPGAERRLVPAESNLKPQTSNPDCPPIGRAVGVHYPPAVGAGVWVWGPNTVPLACMPCGGFVPRGWWGAVPGGVVCHRCEGRLVSGAVPPPAACPLERAARVPRPVCPGCGRCGRGDPATAPQRAPLPAGVARCGVGGRASPGGVPSTIVRGV